MTGSATLVIAVGEELVQFITSQPLAQRKKTAVTFAFSIRFSYYTYLEPNRTTTPHDTALADLQLPEPSITLNLHHAVQIPILTNLPTNRLARLIHQLHHHPDAAEGREVDLCPSLLVIRGSRGVEQLADRGVLGAVEREIAVLLRARAVVHRDADGDRGENDGVDVGDCLGLFRALAGVSTVYEGQKRETHVGRFRSALADRCVLGAGAGFGVEDTVTLAVSLAFQRARSVADGAAELEVGDECVGFVGCENS